MYEHLNHHNDSNSRFRSCRDVHNLLYNNYCYSCSFDDKGIVEIIDDFKVNLNDFPALTTVSCKLEDYGTTKEPLRTLRARIVQLGS